MTGDELATFSADTIEVLKSHLPNTANVNNPADVIGNAAKDRYENVLSATIKVDRTRKNKMTPSTNIRLFFLIFFLSSCTAAIPPSSLQLSGVKMNLERPAKNISTMAISKDGSLLITIENAVAIGSTSGTSGYRNDPARQTLRVWDLVQGRQIKSITINDLQHIASVAISPDGKYALIGGRQVGSGSSLGIWDLASGTQIKTFPELKKEVFCVAFSPDGRSLLATHGTFVSLFNTETGAFTGQFDTGYRAFFFPLPMHIVATFTPDGQYILSGGSDAVLRLWDIESGKKVQALVGHERSYRGGITGIAISSDGQFAFTSAAGDSSARKWDIANGQLLQKFSGLNNAGSGTKGTAVSPDNNYGFIASQPLALWDLATGKPVVPLRWDTPTSIDRDIEALYHPNGKSLLLHAGDDAAIRLIDTATGRQQAMLVGFDNDEWIVISSEGYFNASGKGTDYLTTSLEGKNLPVERFYDAFYRPDIVMAILQGEDTRNIATLTLAEAVKDPPPLVQFTAQPSDTQDGKTRVCYQVTNTGGGIGELRLFHNGKLAVSDGYYRDIVRSPSDKLHLMAMNGAAIHEQMRSVSIRDAGSPKPIPSQEKGANFNDCKEITPVAGENEVTLTAFNKSNTIQSTIEILRFRSNKTPEDPHLYILSIGTNKYKEKAINLKYATKNATDIQQKLRRQAATILAPGNIHHELLLNDTADKSNILKKVNELASIIKPEDSFIFFVAGHGILLQNQYYILTSNYNGTLSDANTISSNELIDIAKKIQSINQFFVFDTCQIGGVDSIVGSLYDARMSILAKKMGLPIFTSTSSVQEALDGYQGNGLFTHTLLDGLNNKQEADTNNDRAISLCELGNYAKQSTTTLSKKIGSQQTPLILNCGKDYPLYKIQ